MLALLQIECRRAIVLKTTAFKSFYVGQLTLSTQLIKLPFCVLLPSRSNSTFYFICNPFMLFCDLTGKPSTVCQSRKDECLDNAPPGHFVPQCKADGSYEERQCLQSTGECWCVDRNGNELPGTRSKEMHDCSLLGE